MWALRLRPRKLSPSSQTFNRQDTNVRKKQVEEENHERWLVSYADFVTLLFALFVVLFASSTVDQTKMESFAANFESYVKHNRKGAAEGSGAPHQPVLPAASPPDMPVALTMAELRPAIEQLGRDLMPEIQQGKIELSLQPRGLIMSLRESGFFGSGEAGIRPESLVILTKVAEALTRIPGQIRLEGHTDDTPIHTSKYPSNWQLSAARAISVLKLLRERYDIPASRLAVAGYGEYAPLSPNDTPANRAKNRRVDLVILTKDAAEMEPESGRPARR
jgi:chemotaxis protein MotB